jgi:predicted TIM-barrel fold metal-dependent hydrolase
MTVTQTVAGGLAIDLHQHLWTEPFVDRLRARSHLPCLRGWTIYTRGEAPYEIDPADHDVDARIAADRDAGVGLACLSLSAPLGIEDLPAAEATTLIGAWHEGVASLPSHFAAWASVPMSEPDPAEIGELLDSGFVGVQVPATHLLTPTAWERAGDVLRAVEQAGRPVLVHPGAAYPEPAPRRLPAWWAPVVDYVSQMQAAWWGWHAVRGRELFPNLRLVFAAGAGLAPVHQERHRARGGADRPVDTDVFVDTSSYGPRGVDALIRVLGIDPVVLGSDRPYGGPADLVLGDAATHAIGVTNPQRALGDPVAHTNAPGGLAWRQAM